jgi:hypothetical protein
MLRVRLLCCFEDIHHRLAFLHALLTAPQHYLRCQRRCARLVVVGRYLEGVVGQATIYSVFHSYCTGAR